MTSMSDSCDLFQYEQKTKTYEKDGLVVKSEMLLPQIPYFCGFFWRRHGYSHEDIRETLKMFRPYHLWPAIIMRGLGLNSSAVKASYTTDDPLIWGAKQPAIKDMMHHVSNTEYPVAPQADCLVYDTKVHKPFLPYHVLNASDFRQISMIVGRNIIYPWKGISAVAIRFERDGGLILMKRVIKFELYEQLFPQPAECLILQLPEFKEEATDVRWVILNEAWFFSGQKISQDANKRKNKSNNNKKTKEAPNNKKEKRQAKAKAKAK
jgi:hypothetical protein